MNVCAKCHDNPSNTCQDNFIKNQKCQTHYNARRKVRESPKSLGHIVWEQKDKIVCHSTQWMWDSSLDENVKTFCWWQKMKRRGIAKVISHHLGTINVCMKCDGNASSSCWDISERNTLKTSSLFFVNIKNGRQFSVTHYLRIHYVCTLLCHSKHQSSFIFCSWV